MENSWYLKKEGVHHFFCKCGEHKKLEALEENNIETEIDKFNREEIELRGIPNLYHPDNACAVCNNEKYLDKNSLLFDDRTRYWSEIKWQYETLIDDEKWKVRAFLKVPNVESDSKKSFIETIELATCTVYKDGKKSLEQKKNDFFKKSMLVGDKYVRIDRILKEKISEHMLNSIVNNPNRRIEWLNKKEKNLENILFFLENPSIRSQDMVQWKNRIYFLETMRREKTLENCLAYFLNYREEKSLAKIQFASYQNMMELGGYNPMVDYVFSRTITDMNHLRKALGMNVEIKQRLFDESRIEDIYHFIDFLKQRYEEKHLVRFWLSITLNDLAHYLLNDSISLFRNEDMRDELNIRFEKTRLNIRDIHDELSKHSRRVKKLKIKNEVFSYTNYLIESKVSLENIFYELPVDTQELYEWGGILHNCLFSYADNISRGSSIIYGLFVENTLCYAIEIYNHKIIQASASFNRSLSKEEKEKVEKWHKEVYLKNLMKAFN